MSAPLKALGQRYGWLDNQKIRGISLSLKGRTCHTGNLARLLLHTSFGLKMEQVSHSNEMKKGMLEKDPLNHKIRCQYLDCVQ